MTGADYAAVLGAVTCAVIAVWAGSNVRRWLDELEAWANRAFNVETGPRQAPRWLHATLMYLGLTFACDGTRCNLRICASDRAEVHAVNFPDHDRKRGSHDGHG